MSNPKDRKKKYDGTGNIIEQILGDANLKGNFCIRLHELQGGDSMAFEQDPQLAGKLQAATTTTVTGIGRLARRISGALSGTGNKDAHNANRWVAKLASSAEEGPLRKMSPPTDCGIVLLTGWYESIKTDNPDTAKITDDRAYQFVANAAQAAIEVAGYTVQDVLEFQPGR